MIRIARVCCAFWGARVIELLFLMFGCDFDGNFYLPTVLLLLIFHYICICKQFSVYFKR